ncbi:MAG TPA: DUF4349 domain-containing protein, partial [Phycisphaerales bacterium]|nr:DUF4349 domain-containing protein [Phycisphaerales bacterium]
AVIRKTTLDLATPDVRAAFSKAGLVINEALGEYVETSSLTGEGPAAQGSLTLRVSARRLSEALNQLRPLGVVVSEATTGQDVTDAVVDLDARIRNEQRIEKELLALIEKRPDAPLKELMEIRSQLAGVRGQIESLIGQRERIGRMVSLATILVTIRPPTPVDALKPEKADGIGTYFSSSIADAWRSSLQALIDTAAFLVRTLVGGLVWWVLAAAVTVACVRAFRRAFPRGGAEPAPAA